MKSLSKILMLFLAIGLAVSCSKPSPQNDEKESPYTFKYENDLFSIEIPKDWTYDDTNWKGLDSIRNEVDFFGPSMSSVMLHIVKAFVPYHFENVKEAADIAKLGRLMSSDDVVLLTEMEDSFELGGYPTRVLYFMNFVGNDTIIQKQYVTYLEDSHITVYVNENFYNYSFTQAQMIADPVVETIRYKKVKNPFDVQESLESAFEELHEKVKDNKETESMKSLIEELEKNR